MARATSISFLLAILTAALLGPLWPFILALPISPFTAQHFSGAWNPSNVFTLNGFVLLLEFAVANSLISVVFLPVIWGTSKIGESIVLSIFMAVGLAFVVTTIWYWENVFKEIHLGFETPPLNSFGQPLYKLLLGWLYATFMALTAIPFSLQVLVPMGLGQIYLLRGMKRGRGLNGDAASC
jgi:hypothetical protein